MGFNNPALSRYIVVMSDRSLPTIMMLGFSLYSMPVSLIRNVFEITLNVHEIALLLVATNCHEFLETLLQALDGCTLREVSIKSNITVLPLWLSMLNIAASKLIFVHCCSDPSWALAIRCYLAKTGSRVESLRVQDINAAPYNFWFYKSIARHCKRVKRLSIVNVIVPANVHHASQINNLMNSLVCLEELQLHGLIILKFGRFQRPVKVFDSVPCPRVQRLIMDSVDDDAFEEIISKCSCLQSLVVLDCESIPLVKPLPHCTSLYIMYCAYSCKIIDCLRLFAHLQHLRLHGANLPNDCLLMIKELKLQSLDISGCYYRRDYGEEIGVNQICDFRDKHADTFDYGQFVVDLCNLGGPHLF